MYENLNNFLNELHLEKIPQKLQKFDELDFDEFVKEYTKAKKIKFADKLEERNFKNDWSALFENDKKAVSELKAEIAKTDKEIDALMLTFGKKAHNASKLLEYLYQRPIISVSDIVEPLGITKQTANLLVKEFEGKGILREVTGYQRNKLFVFERYLNIYSPSKQAKLDLGNP